MGTFGWLLCLREGLPLLLLSYAAEANLELVILLSPPLECSDYRGVLPHLVLLSAGSRTFQNRCSSELHPWSPLLFAYCPLPTFRGAAPRDPIRDKALLFPS